MNGAGFQGTPLRRGLLIAAGSLSVGLGVVGIFVPLLPAAPFFLLAAACYVRSSNRFYRRLLANRVVRGYLENYRTGSGLPGRTKAVTILVLWITLAVSAFMVQIWWVWIILGAVGLGVPILILFLTGP